MKRHVTTAISLKKTNQSRWYSSGKSLAAALIMALAPLAMSAQVATSYNFNADLEGWSSGGGSSSYFQTPVNACEGGSARANVYYGQHNYFISPNLGASDAGIVTVSFDYKVVNYSGGGNVPTPSADFALSADWSNSTSGPWTTFYELDGATHTPSTTCATKTATFTPGAGNLYIRMKSTSGPGTDLYFYYDNIIVSQGAPPTCSPASAVVATLGTIAATGFTATWTAPTTAPAEGYIYELRSSGAAGSGAAGLITGGTTAAGVTTASFTGLTASTSYTLYVQAKCSSTDFSSWSSSTAIQTSCAATDVPYAMPLAGVSTPALPACVIVENLNNDNKTWRTQSNVTGMSGIVMQYPYGSVAANDWFYTQSLNLVADVTYRLAFKYKISAFQEKLKVAIGTSATATSMTTTLFDVTIPSTETNVITKIIDFTVDAAGAYNIGFQAHSAAGMNSLYVGDISVIVGPTCFPPTSVSISNLDKNTATISWNASTPAPANGYSYEIRTSGTAGSGATGLVASGTTAIGILTANITGLSLKTSYQVYVSSNCAAADQSEWSTATTMVTFCDYLDLVAVNDTICAGSTATLEVTGADTEVSWYATDSSTEVLATGASFTTTELSATTNYYAQAVNTLNGQIEQIGAGAKVVTSYQSPFYAAWSNIHSQHMVTAAEMIAKGYVAGPIVSVALTVTDAGSLPMIDLSVKMGMSTAADLTEFVDNVNFNTVFNSASFMPVVGLNVMTFATPFEWDGTSNIVLEFCHGNPASTSSMYRSVLADDTAFVSTIKAHVSAAATAAASCANITSNKATYSTRPVFTFSGTTSCEGPSRTEVIATVNAVPVLTAEATQVITVDALEDATLADLEPSGTNIAWFATGNDATANTNELVITTQLVSGTTYYAVSTENDCRSLSVAVTVTVALGTVSQTMNGLSYYPNPVHNQLNINYSENITSIAVFNLVGQKVMNVTPNATNVILDMARLSAGTYMIQVNADAASKVIKLIKK